jgi:hypothetical protein
MEYKRKHNRTIMIPYLFDPFVDSHTLHRLKWNRRLKRKSNVRLETEMLDMSSKVFCVNHLKEHFIKYKQYIDNLIFTEHPLLKRICGKEMATSLEKVDMNLTYAGVFDKKIRNPKYLLKFMSYILPQMDARLHLYTYGNCTDIIKSYATASEGRIIDHGFVPKDEADGAVNVSDVLICVGNIDNLQAPSKIFEYISAGKPIIHFYTVDDINVEILKDYPLCICLKQDDDLLQENAEKCIRFCRDNKNKTLDFTEVEEIYYYAKPKFIADQISAIINRSELIDMSKDPS